MLILYEEENVNNCTRNGPTIIHNWIQGQPESVTDDAYADDT